MAFELRNLQPVGSTSRSGLQGSDKDNTSQLWSYMHIGDTVENMIVAGYFNAVRDLIQTHDAIILQEIGDEDWRVSFFNVVPKSPLKTDVTLSSLSMIAS